LPEAFARRPAGARLLVAGGGPDRPARRRRAQRSGSRAHFTGFGPHVRVPAVLRHVDMPVLPRLQEDLGSALTEAMAAGLPAVATGAGGTAGLVHDGVNRRAGGGRPRSRRARRRHQPGPRRPGSGRRAGGGRAAHRGRLPLARPGPHGAGGLQGRDQPRP